MWIGENSSSKWMYLAKGLDFPGQSSLKIFRSMIHFVYSWLQNNALNHLVWNFCHSFTQHIFIGCLLCGKHCTRGWGYNYEQDTVTGFMALTVWWETQRTKHTISHGIRFIMEWNIQCYRNTEDGTLLCLLEAEKTSEEVMAKVRTEGQVGINKVKERVRKGMEGCSW